MLVGILAIQGGYAAHAKMFKYLGVSTCCVRTADQLVLCDGLVMPGGESTTILSFIQHQPDLSRGIQDFASQNKPIFGTCAGAVLLADNVLNPSQDSLHLLDMSIERNSYGRQTDSHICRGIYIPAGVTSEMVFIRAPRIQSIGKNVIVLGQCQNQIVCVQQDHIIAAAFHPELSEETVWHEYFLNLINKNKK
jgi:5'-phosphate synthase pdxT subunit